MCNIKNCTNCSAAYLKDINFDEAFPEYVYICGEDNRYIGYHEEAVLEVCEKWKN